jgi:hypothetical protein
VKAGQGQTPCEPIPADPCRTRANVLPDDCAMPDFVATNSIRAACLTEPAGATRRMTSADTSQVLAATRQWLEPAVYVLLRSGVTWKEFSELSKSTYVDVATKRFGKRGRPTNVSRTAVLTGLARREVRKQRERLSEKPAPQGAYVTKASLVLSAWHLHPEYLDRNGKPAPLKLDGEGATFATLLRRCGASDVPASTLLKELVSSGAVRQRADGRLEALQRNYIPHAMEEQLIRLWGTVMADVATTYAHNLTRTGRAPSRFERAAVNERVAASDVAEFREFLDREGQAMLERIDAWLSAHEVSPSGEEPSPPTVRLGAGLYHIQD